MAVQFGDDLNSILGGFGEDAYDRLARILSPFAQQQPDRPGGGVRPGNPIDLSGLSAIFSQNPSAFNPTQTSFISRILGRGGETPYEVDDSFAQYFGQNEQGYQRFLDILGRHAGRKGFTDILGQSGGIFGLDQLGQLLSSTAGTYDNFTNPTSLAFMQRIFNQMSNYNGGNGGGGDGGSGGGGGGGTGGGNPTYTPPTGPGGPGGGTDTGSPFLQELMDILRQRLSGPLGYDPQLMEQSRNSIMNRLAQREDQALGNLNSRFNVAGLYGSGENAVPFDVRPTTVSQGISELAAQSLLGLEQSNAQFAGQQEQGLLSLASQLAGLEQSGMLGGRELDIREMLGMGALDLDQQRVDLSRLGYFSDLAMRQFLMNLGLLGFNFG